MMNEETMRRMVRGRMFYLNGEKVGRVYSLRFEGEYARFYTRSEGGVYDAHVFLRFMFERLLQDGDLVIMDAQGRTAYFVLKRETDGAEKQGDTRTIYKRKGNDMKCYTVFRKDKRTGDFYEDTEAVCWEREAALRVVETLKRAHPDKEFIIREEEAERVDPESEEYKEFMREHVFCFNGGDTDTIVCTHKGTGRTLIVPVSEKQ